METFTTLTAIAAPLPIANVDTDMLAPGEAMKTVSKTGLEDYLFADMRYRPDGSEDPDFVLNKPAYRKARILIGGDNFGCGSSREHAVWCLKDFGIHCIIAPSFADIFTMNSIRNGLLLITLSQKEIDRLMNHAENGANATFTIDLPHQTVTCPDGETVSFEIDEYRKTYLLSGTTDTARLGTLVDMINTFETNRHQAQPWLRTSTH